MSSTPASFSHSIDPLDAPSTARDVSVRVEVGRVCLTLAELAQIQDGHVIPLDQAADSPVELYVGERLIARGHIVVVHDQYSVQLTELVENPSPATGN